MRTTTCSVLRELVRASTLLLLVIGDFLAHVRCTDEGIFFYVEKPKKLEYIYQINPSYHIGARFPPQPLEDIALIYADPPHGCEPLVNARHVKDEVVLMERGECSFVAKALNAQEAGARIALITDSASGSDEFIDMIADETKRRAEIPVAYLPGNSGKHIREYLLYEKPLLWIRIPLNYTTKLLRDVPSKPPWELW
ncbi:protease-associated domain-containing protein [Aphelenchoides avenae]|nr:protease-associated domain-containing protein [Aphelenchus avenae]